MGQARRERSEIITRQRQAAAQAAEITTDNSADGTELFEGRIALAAFHAADVAGRDVGFEREGLLRQAFGFRFRVAML